MRPRRKERWKSKGNGEKFGRLGFGLITHHHWVSLLFGM